MSIAVYPGTFDPVTCGHGDIVRRAALLFEKVIVAVAVSEGKQPEWHVDDRVVMAQKAFSGLANVEIKPFTGLLVAFAKNNGANVIIRGLRAVSDFEYEFQLAAMNRHLDEGIETIFLTPAEQYTFISSSLVREVARLGGDVSDFVHPEVKKALLARYN